jgi:large subunit ribosomal protein L10
MNRDEKAAVVDEIAGQLNESDAVFAVDYRGITVTQAAQLRTKLRDADTSFRVVKNSLSELAADKAGADGLKPLLKGPTALAFVRGDAAMAAKTLSDTARQLHLLEFKGGLMNGNALSAADVQSIARLPAREVLYAQLVGTVAAPLTGLARGLNALISGLAIQLKAIADQGLVSGTGAAAEPTSAAEAAVEPTSASAAEAAAEPTSASAAPAESEAESQPRVSRADGDATPAAAAEPEAPAEPEAAAEREPELAAAEPEPEPAAAEPEPEVPAAEPDDPDSEPHDTPVQPSQAEGEDPDETQNTEEDQ